MNVERAIEAGKKRKGYTIIEMLVVMSIVGILMAIVLPRVVGRGYNNACHMVCDE